MNDFRKKTILLVEDEMITSLAETAMLKRNGYAVVAASSGLEAVQIVRERGDIDLVLTDINLGDGIDGVEAARIMMSERDLPVIFLSSHTEKEVADTVRSVSRYGYIAKSSGENVILASIEMAFKLHSSLKRTWSENASLAEIGKFLHGIPGRYPMDETGSGKNAEGPPGKSIALVAEIERLRSIVDNIHGGVMVLNSEGEISFFNEGLCVLFGYTRDEISAKRYYDFVQEKDRPGLIEKFKARQNGEVSVRTYEIEVVKKGG